MRNTKTRKGESGVRELFMALIKQTTPNGFEHLVYDFIPTSHVDSFGNHFVIVGDGPHHHLFTCHLDTYPLEDDEGFMRSCMINVIDEGDIIRTDGTSILGADDKAGMTVMLTMIEAGIPGIYGFFLAEEIGLYGSKHAAKEKDLHAFLNDVKAVISFDRKETSSIITHQRNTRTCSEGYALQLQSAFADAGLILSLDPKGTATDSWSFFKYDSTLECTNISVGYWDQHTHCEYQDIAYLEQLCKAVITMQWPVP